ncbi:MAG: hypothetical protein HN837_09530 [Chloroflexi bacterium]|nr:hypothetical protein [Chloroflexota bacterium]
MSRVKRLYELQEVDLAIKKEKKAISAIEAQLQDSHEVIEARAKLEQEEKRLSETRKTEKQLEWDIEELTVKIDDVNKQLFGGSVKNPKDLASLNEECEHFKQRRTAMEDGLLELMTDLEQRQGDFDLAKSQYEQIQSEWLENNGHLVEDKTRFEGEIAGLTGKREQMASQLGSADLAAYEKLLLRVGSQPVGKVEQGMCKGGRINLPTNTIKNARPGLELIYCPNCGRILYVS